MGFLDHLAYYSPLKHFNKVITEIRLYYESQTDIVNKWIIFHKKSPTDVDDMQPIFPNIKISHFIREYDHIVKNKFNFYIARKKQQEKPIC